MLPSAVCTSPATSACRSWRGRSDNRSTCTGCGGDVAAWRELFGDDFGDVEHGHRRLLCLHAVAHHGHAEGASDGDRVGAGGEELFGALDVDALALALLHPHPPSAGAAAQSTVARARGLNEVDDGKSTADGVARRIVDGVVAAQIARV